MYPLLRFAKEIVPVSVPQRKGDPVIVDRDVRGIMRPDPAAARIADTVAVNRDRVAVRKTNTVQNRQIDPVRADQDVITPA